MNTNQEEATATLHAMRHRRLNGNRDKGLSDEDEDGLVILRRSTPTPPSFLADPVIICILITETAERFAYFGFRAILVLYFTMELEYTESQAIAIYAYNSALAYFSPLLGATLADGGLGRYRTILWFGAIYVVGLAVLTGSAATDSYTTVDVSWKRFGSFAGLFLVCLGTGGIKPCVSAFGADQVYLKRTAASQVAEHQQFQPASAEELQPQHQPVSAALVDPCEGLAETEDDDTPQQVRAFFNYFYACINVGALTSIALVPIFRGVAGFGLAFFVPCLCMTGAIVLFVSKRNDYVHQSSSSGENSMRSTFRITWYLLFEKIFSNAWVAENFSRSGLVPCDDPSQVQAAEHGNIGTGSDPNNHDDQDGGQRKQQLGDAAQVIHILPVLATFPIFWCLYDQQGSVWTLQATRMGLPSGLQPEQMNIVNPLEIIIFIPLFDKVVYPFLEERGLNIAPLRRMAWGMVFTAAAFVVSGVVESKIQHNEEKDLAKLNVFWQLPQITLLAIGEIFLSVTGLEFAYQKSPDRLKAFLTAIFLATTGVGDSFSGILYSTVFAHMNRAVVMHLCACLMLLNLRLFLWVAKWYEDGEALDRSTALEGLELQSSRDP